MKRYDCSKTLDYAHEFTRMCNEYGECTDGCPMMGHYCDSYTRMQQLYIDIVQKWSDEHPEKPKLTKRERAFLECFKRDESCNRYRNIRRVDNGLRLFYGEFQAMLTEGLFSFLKLGEGMTFEELLELEVDDED